MKRQFAVLCSVLAVSACAKRPDAIVPTEIPMAAYSNGTCLSLSQDLLKEREKLSALSKAQNNAANGDAFGVFLVGVPMSSTFGGDKEGEVSVSKGKVVAIESALKAKGCP